MNIKNLSKLCLLSTAVLFSSCSVIMAARKEGTSIENIQASCSRGQLLAQGPIVISSERNDENQLVEVYQFKKETGSAARAFMHGVLDVSTLGIWEVVGTPIEACLDTRQFFSLRVTYDECENVSRIELL